jgi:putative MATE family efflux protein
MLPLVFRMAIPGVAAQLVNLLYNIVDRIYIGHIPGIGTDALAGVGVTSSVIILISAFSAIVGSGAAPLAAIALGTGDHAHAQRILGNGFFLLLVFTFLTTTAAAVFMRPILLLTGASSNTLGYAVSYLSIYLTGTFFVMIATGLNPFINCQGRPGIAMCSVLVGAVLNIVLDPIFIFGLNMGVAGAALATIISQACSATWVLGFLVSRRASLRLSLQSIRPEARELKPILALGLSPFVMSSTESLVGFVLNGSLVGFGDLYVSTLTVMQSAMHFVSVPLSGFAQGTVPIVSYNYGHGNAARVRQCFRIMLTVMFSYNFALTTLMIAFPSFIGALFTDDAVLLASVARFMPLFLAGMTIFGLQRACQNTFVALGQPKVSLFIALLRKVFLLIPLALLLPRFFGVSGVFAAEAVADATAAILCTIIFAFRFLRILASMPKRGSEVQSI